MDSTEQVDPVEDCLSYCKSKLSGEQLQSLMQRLEDSSNHESQESPETRVKEEAPMLEDDINER